MQENEKEFAEMLYFIPGEFAKAGGLWLLRAGRNMAKPTYQAGPNILPYYAFHFVMDGKVELTFGRDNVVLSRGDVFCMYPGVTYRYRYYPDPNPLKMIWISFDGAQVPTLIAKAGFLQTSPFLKKVMTKELHHVLEQLFIPPTEGFKRHLEQQAALYRIFGRIMPEDEPSAARTGTDYWVERSIEYMNTHYMDGISVQDVANYSSIHRGYLSKIFTLKVGMTPMRYLEKLRMEKAKELLQTTAYTINEIGLTLSYPDPYTFTHAFSKYFGVPPGKLRKTNAGQDEP